LNSTYAGFLELVNAVWKRRWRALIAAWIVCLLGWMLVVAKIDTYTSTTKIFIDTAGVLKPLLRGLAIERDVDNELEVMKQTLTSRSNLEKVARSTDLDITATTPEKMEKLLDRLRDRTSVRTEGRFLLSISYRDTDPVRARDVVQAISRIFVETTIGESREEIEEAQHFLERQIAQYEKALEAAEARLAAFKEEKLSKLPDQRNYQFRVDELRAELEEAEAVLRRARVQRTQLQSQVERQPSSNIAGLVAETQQQLNELLTRYTERHPDVIALRRKIAAQKATEKTADTSGAGATGSAARPDGSFVTAEFEDIKLKQSENEADIAAYEGRVTRLRARLERLESLAALVPDAEMEQARLLRNYDVLKIKHGELQARREQAKISRDREAGSDRIQYEVVDVARIPAIPDGPSRSLMISAVLFVSLISGLGVAIAMSFLNTGFADPMALQRAFGIAVLGTVSMVQTMRRQTWQVAKHSSFVACVLLLFVAYGGMMLAEQKVGWKNVVKGDDLEKILDQILSVVELI